MLARCAQYVRSISGRLGVAARGLTTEGTEDTEKDEGKQDAGGDGGEGNARKGLTTERVCPIFHRNGQVAEDR